MWLDNADVEKLLDPDARPARRITKFWATPLVWMAARHPGDTVERTVAPDTREEVRHKLSHFIRSRRSEEHTSELQSLMRTSYAVFCLKKQKQTINTSQQLTPRNQRSTNS